MKRPVYRALGLMSVVLGAVGAVLPLLPTTPFLILAAYFFARSHPEWEARLLAHPTVGPSIRAWRDHGAIPKVAKRVATVLLAISAVGGWFTLPLPWAYVPGAIGACVLTVRLTDKKRLFSALTAAMPVIAAAGRTAISAQSKTGNQD